MNAKTGDPNRPISKAELLDSVIRARHRLSRHIDSHLAGDYAAIDDIAAVMRTLCAQGKGDDLLRRFIKRFELADVPLFLSQAPEASSGVQVVVGSFPNLRPDNGAVGSSLLNWLTTPAACFIDKNGRTTSMTWAKLIGAIGNTWGSHATEHFAPWIDQSALHGVSGLTLTDFMLERAATIVEDCLGELLIAQGSPLHARMKRILPVRPTDMGWMRIIALPGDLVEIEFKGGPSRHDPEDGVYPLVRVERSGVVVGTDLVVQLGIPSLRPIRVTPGRSARR
ncbi:hypothetical protein [Pseudoclavibacter sp. 8L]|uniref:hypothetical protein n=1 Tax=Pseudoclavibacter sp. 8L TaxID=2653162 RepID=UPI0012EFCC92|nr:hypothetical protein [Pseudoclavibacter sp. 8L]VXB29293.1 conserved hypothetical protein [Pseudoclavibacter sp. 8L]